MKKINIIVALLAVQLGFAQYMIVGKDSISVQDFKKDNLYGLQNSGIEKSISNVQDFLLLQQFAKERKADTLSVFKERVGQTMGEIREKSFYPESLVSNATAKYVKDNQTEKNILFFAVEKKEGDTTDYQQVYNDVVSGKMTMEDAMKKYMKLEASPIPLYIKPGLIEPSVYNELSAGKIGGYSKFINNSAYAAFGKLVNTRPSLGYMIFGTLSYPNDANAEKKKAEIFAALTSGKKFVDVAAEFGTTDNEKKNGGAIMGSPTLPDNVYELLKGKKAGDYTQPILIKDSYFIFNIYNILPYTVSEESKDFYKREMMNSNYFDTLQEDFINQLKASSKFKEGKDFGVVNKSYVAFKAFKNPTAVLATFGKNIFTYNELKTDIDTNFINLDKISPEDWFTILKGKINQFVLKSYSDDFDSTPEVEKQIEEVKKNLYSEYIFSTYIKNEVESNPALLTQFYNKNKSKYMWEERGQGRVAILSDDKMTSEIKSEMKNIKNWETLKKKYYGKLNDKNQILVHFEEGNMSKDADVFTKNGVPFKKGLTSTKLNERTLVIAIDDILPPSQMTLEEATDSLKDAVTEDVLKNTIQQQKAKTKIVVEPGFIKELEKNFKK